MFYIRTDGNSQIGAGHVMRCLSIAEALRDLGELVLFIIADEEPVKLIESRGFGYLVLHTDWRDMEAELQKLLAVISENEIESLLIDSYQITEKYMHTLMRYVKTAYLDDCGETVYPTDMLINYNIYAPEIDYKSMYQKKGITIPKLVLGIEYVPVRKEFGNIEYRVKELARDVLITTGGADMYNATEHILSKLLEKSDRNPFLRYRVVSGAYNEHIEKLRNIAKTNNNVYLYENVPDMWNLIKRCDIAISAAGSTMYELATIGVPTVCFYFVENQRQIAKACEVFAKNAGNYVLSSEQTVDKIVDYVWEYNHSYCDREIAYEKTQQMELENGVFRLAEELKNYGITAKPRETWEIS